MRSCEEYELLLSALLDGELSDRERAETTEHLAACPRCRQYFDDLAAMRDAFAREEVPVPEGFSEGIMAQVRDTAQEERKVIRFPRWRRWTALAACCALVALGVWSVQRQDQKLVSQTSMADSPMVIMTRGAEPEESAAGDGAIYLVEDAAVELEAPEEELRRDDALNSGALAADSAESVSWEEADMEDSAEFALPAPTSAAEKTVSGLISGEDAKDVALTHAGFTAGEVTFTEAELDREDQLYEIEFYAGDSRYEYEIDAVSGEILTCEAEVEEKEETAMKMSVQVGTYTFTATLEDNDAVRELTEMLQAGPVTIHMSDYSGFEKVGPLGKSLTASNSQTTTAAGDIVLYNGNNIVMFYGSNSWSYTRIGKIDDLTDWTAALGGGDVTAVFTLVE